MISLSFHVVGWSYWLVSWLVGWLISWLVAWLVDQLVVLFDKYLLKLVKLVNMKLQSVVPPLPFHIFPTSWCHR